MFVWIYVYADASTHIYDELRDLIIIACLRLSNALINAQYVLQFLLRPITPSSPSGTSSPSHTRDDHADLALVGLGFRV
jgi:hypothetical protein